ncbi:MAG: hypothetical protein ACLRMJ_06375 [Alistipes finegoldii]
MEQRQTFRFVQRYKTRRFAGPAVIKTKANLKAEVSAVYDALLTWEGDPPPSGSHMEIGRHTAFGDVTGCNAFHITGLSPATEYALSIAQVSDTVDSSKDMVFNTEPTSPISVRICVPDEDTRTTRRSC